MMFTQMLNDFGKNLELIDEAFDIWLDRRFIKSAGGVRQCPISTRKLQHFAKKYKLPQPAVHRLFCQLDSMDSALAERYCELLDILRAGARESQMSMGEYWREYSAGFEYGFAPGHA